MIRQSGHAKACGYLFVYFKYFYPALLPERTQSSYLNLDIPSQNLEALFSTLAVVVSMEIRPGRIASIGEIAGINGYLTVHRA